jgi:uncharacterized protein DUF4127/beta-N-acetylglucosaminidase-like protein
MNCITIFYKALRVMFKNCLLPTAYCLLICCLLPIALAQRPKLKPPSRDYFAGKILLIPQDDRPSSLQQPRMIAAIADHDLVAPPARIIGDAAKTIEWAKSIDYDGIDGAIVSLDNFPEPMELIKIIRSQRPAIPIYTFIKFSESSKLIDRVIDEVGPEKLIDLLAIGSQNQSDREWQKSYADKIASRRIANRFIFNNDTDSTALSLLSRMINQRFGFAPRILPAYSTATNRDSAVQQIVGDKIKKSSAIEIRQNSDGGRGVEIILFILTANSRDSDWKALIDTVAQTADKNVRIGLIDLSGQQELGNATIAELRRRKLIDKLSTFAAIDPATESPGSAVARAIAQISAYTAAIRFLRDDLDRVRRIDRAQIALLLSRYLTDWAYTSQVRPKIQTGANREAAEAFVLNQVKPIADDLFEDQFKRNAHSYLLSYGERADFEVRLLQRLLVRLYTTSVASPPSFEVEIKPSIYIYHHGNEIVPQLRSLKYWELSNNEELDERVGRRWNAIDWPIFKTDAQSVGMGIKIESPSAARSDTQQSYTIVSKRSRESRRIEINATTPRGAFYALSKLELMGADGQLVKDFQMNETPAFQQRGIIESSTGWSHRERIEMLRFLGRIRMNRYYYLQNFEDRANLNDEKIKELQHEADENFVQLVLGFNLSNSDLNDRNFTAMAGQFDRLAALGIRSFAIGLENDQEKQAAGNIVSVQAGFINRMREHLKRSGNFELAIWPKSAPTGDYLKLLSAAIPTDLQLLRAQTPAAAASIDNDNRPRKVFDPIEQLCLGPGSGNHSLLAENPPAYLVAAAEQLQFTKLIAAKASEQAWNGTKYDAERALNSALNLLFDERSRASVRAWVEHFEDCKNSAKTADKTRDLVERRLQELQSALESITGTRERGLLRGEFAQFINDVREADVRNQELK